VGSVMVIDGLKLRISGPAYSDTARLSIARCRHSGTVFLMPMASDLSYLHLRRLPVLRILGTLFFGRSGPKTATTKE
jgi:hypothetical protein